MYCPYCGKEIADGSRFCAYCGHNLSEVNRAYGKDNGAAENQTQSAHTERNSSAGYQMQDGYQTQEGYQTQGAGSANDIGSVNPAAGAKKILFWGKVAAGAVAAAAVVGIVFGVHQAIRPDDGEAEGNAVASESGDSTESVRGGTDSGSATVVGGSADNNGVFAGEGQSVVIDGQIVKALSRPSLADTVTPTEVNVNPQIAAYTVSGDFSNISVENDRLTYMPDDEKALLAQNGFFVDPYGSDEFYETYENNMYNYDRNFITSDSMMHTYHLYFEYLQKNVEQNNLRGMLNDLSQQMLTKSSQQYDALKGTEWETAAKRNVGFFAVGASLLDGSTQVPDYVADPVSQELALINNASGMQVSPLFDSGDGSVKEDYTQYKPRGYYDGNADLQSYFRAMMWYGRMNFTQSDEDLNRSALLMTLALEGDTATEWQNIYEVTSFFAGASDDSGYFEYRPVADAVYGENPSVGSLAGNEEAWQKFREASAAMPGPKVDSMAGTDDTDEEKGYRFMGQRYSFDEEIFTQLTGEQAGENADGQLRGLPDAVDVPAAMGSDAALQIMTDRGATDYANYSANMQTLRDAAASRDTAEWTSCLSSEWLYTLQSLLTPAGEGYPSFMQSDAWTKKELQTYLGSYTELKHDTVLYGKQVMVEMGGEVDACDDRGYVEPQPVLYARLKDLTDATSNGLSEMGILTDEQKQDLSTLSGLCDQLKTISEKELNNELPSDDEFELIRSFGGQLEHFWEQAHKDEAAAAGESMTTQLYPAALVTDVASGGDTCLELGTGRTNTLYAVVPLDGQLVLASGPVYSFYQFQQPSADRLTDAQWCQLLGIQPSDDFSFAENPYSQEDWTSAYLAPPSY